MTGHKSTNIQNQTLSTLWVSQAKVNTQHQIVSDAHVERQWEMGPHWRVGWRHAVSPCGAPRLPDCRECNFETNIPHIVMIPSQVCIINCCGIWLKTAAWVGEDDNIAENTSSSYSTNTSCYSSCCIKERAKELASVVLGVGNDQDENNRNTSSDNSNSSNRSNTSTAGPAAAAWWPPSSRTRRWSAQSRMEDSRCSTRTTVS